MKSIFTESAQRRAAQSLPEATRFWHHLSDYYVAHTSIHDLRTRAISSTFVRQAGITASDHVLDAGCGHLRISLALQRLLPGIELTGVDLTPELLEAGRQLREELGHRPFPLVQADLANLPFDDHSFDHIVSARVFQYIPDPHQALRELQRVLKPGGRLIFSVPNQLNPIKRLRYKGRLHPPSQLGQWLHETHFQHISTGSACFVPGQLRRSWTSSWIGAEMIAELPALGQLGGNAWAAGTKPPLR